MKPVTEALLLILDLFIHWYLLILTHSYKATNFHSDLVCNVLLVTDKVISGV